MRRRAGASPGSPSTSSRAARAREVTLRRNMAAFDRLTLRPRHLVDVSDRSLRTSVLGQEIAMPILIAPTGMARIAAAGAEVEGARAAGRAGTIFTLSTMSSDSIEEVARAAARAALVPARTSGRAPRSPTTSWPRARGGLPRARRDRRRGGGRAARARRPQRLRDAAEAAPAHGARRPAPPDAGCRAHVSAAVASATSPAPA